MDRDAAVLGLGDGDLLQGVLQVGAGGFQLLHQVGPVQELEGGGAVALQPAFQQPADAVAGVNGIEVLGRDAEGLDVLADLLDRRLDRLAHIEDHGAAEGAGFGVKRLLADPGGRVSRKRSPVCG
jgi:hypothetical protein